MKNCIQFYADAINVTATAAMVSGNVYVFGSMIGVAGSNANIGDSIALWVVGVFRLPKAAGALTIGAPVYWDSVAGNVTATVGTNTKLGVVAQAVAPAAGDPTVDVRLGGAF
jgi:predicted RecA/RadA family phage recombinase